MQTGGVRISGLGLAEGTQAYSCHSAWTQESWHSIRREGERARREALSRGSSLVPEEQGPEEGRCVEWRLFRRENSFSGKESSSFISASLARHLTHFSLLLYSSNSTNGASRGIFPHFWVSQVPVCPSCLFLLPGSSGSLCLPSPPPTIHLPRKGLHSGLRHLFFALSISNYFLLSLPLMPPES